MHAMYLGLVGRSGRKYMYTIAKEAGLDMDAYSAQLDQVGLSNSIEADEDGPVPDDETPDQKRSLGNDDVC